MPYPSHWSLDSSGVPAPPPEAEQPVQSRTSPLLLVIPLRPQRPRNLASAAAQGDRRPRISDGAPLPPAESGRAQAQNTHHSRYEPILYTPDPNPL